MRFAFAYGADAVYAGQRCYSLRARNPHTGGGDAAGRADHVRSRFDYAGARGFSADFPCRRITVNWATVKFWQQMGLMCVILSRELSLEKIAESRQEVPEMEIFVHGALCMAYSGRCLLSGYMNQRDSNQGICTNACRWEYKVAEGKQDGMGNIVEV